MSTQSSSLRPRPPCSSATATPSTPTSASARQTPSTRSASARAPSPGFAPPETSPSGHAARTTSGGHSLARRARTASRNAIWSSVNPNLIGTSAPPSSAWQAQAALGRDVALDLVGPGADRAGQRELPALRPRARRLRVGREQVERDLVQLDVELGPPDLHQARLRTGRPTLDRPGDGLQRLEP